MRSHQTLTKRALFALALLAGALPAAYADGRGYQHSQGAARADHWNSSRWFDQPSGPRMGAAPQRQTEVRRLQEREPASPQTGARGDRSAPAQRPIEAWRRRPAEARHVPEKAQANWQWNRSSILRRDRFVPEHRPVHALPPRHQIVIRNGVPFHYFRGVWYRPYGPRFIPVAAPIGAVVAVLPAYHWRVWFYSVPFPYYYVNNVYYVQSAQGYVVTEPPAQQIIQEEPVTGADTGAITEEPADSSEGRAANADPLYVYPKEGQSQEQLDRDRQECRSWASAQTGGASAASAPGSDAAANYERALSACLEGRGYTVR